MYKLQVIQKIIIIIFFQTKMMKCLIFVCIGLALVAGSSIRYVYIVQTVHFLLISEYRGVHIMYVFIYIKALKNLLVMQNKFFMIGHGPIFLEFNSKMKLGESII